MKSVFLFILPQVVTTKIREIYFRRLQKHLCAFSTQGLSKSRKEKMTQGKVRLIGKKRLGHFTKLEMEPEYEKKINYIFCDIDIGANLTDEMYKGFYNGSKKHEPDLDKVLSRAWSVGLEKIFVTAGNLEEAKVAVDLCKENDRLLSTVGVHPTRCSEFDTKLSSPEEYINQLQSLIESNAGKIAALGEFGLDYDRTQFCDVETQKKYFALQLTRLGPTSNLPLFLHCRGAAQDLYTILSENRDCFPRGGVVHSFDGSLEEMELFLQLGLHIGINGCSLKTEDNCKVVREIPLHRLLLETDAPWCGIRPSHASSKFVKTKFETAKKNWNENSMYKSRNEPQTLKNILEAVAGIKELDKFELGETIYENTVKLFL